MIKFIIKSDVTGKVGLRALVHIAALVGLCGLASAGDTKPSRNNTVTARKLTPDDVSDPQAAEAIRQLANRHIKVVEIQQGEVTYLRVLAEHFVYHDTDVIGVRRDEVIQLEFPGEFLGKDYFNDEAVRPIEDLPKGVASISLFHTGITDKTLKLVAATHGPTLRHLDAYRTDITDEGIEALAACHELEGLNIYNTKITDRSLEVIGELEKLRTLRINQTAITDEGLRHLKDLKNLEMLVLVHTAVSDRGLEHLAGLNNLKCLMVGDTRVTEEGIQRLQRALPELTIDTSVEDEEE